MSARQAGAEIVSPFEFLPKEPRVQGVLMAEAMLARRDPLILSAISNAMSTRSSAESLGFLDAIQARLIGDRSQPG